MSSIVNGNFRSEETTLLYKEEITKAIGMHGIWKLRLKQAIDLGSSEFSVEHISPDNECAFGKWLYSLPPSEKQSFHWSNVMNLHADFHKEAARVLQLALTGHKDEAEAAIAFKSEYAKLSAHLTEGMIKWKDDM